MSGYIGVQPVPQATQTRDVFTATAGQTSFATSGYTPGFLDVYLNGVHLVNGTDYTASNGSDVVLTSGATAGDNVEVVAYTTFQVVDQSFSGNFSVDSPTFVVDAANNRVGVGTNSPLGKLSVNSATGQAGFHAGTSVSPERGNLWYDTDGTGWKFNIGKLQSGTFTPQMTLQDNGNVGIGTSSPSKKLHVSSGSSGGAVFQGFYSFGQDNYNIRIVNDGATSGYISQVPAQGGIVVADGMKYYGGGPWTADGTSASSIQMVGGNTVFTNNSGLTAGANFTSSERMRIDSSGRVGINNTSLGDSQLAVTTNAAGTFAGTFLAADANSWGISIGSNSGALAYFYADASRAGAPVGSITENGSSTSYNTSSDYRLKENVVPLSGAADRLAQIPVHRFNFIADPDRTVDGFLAHEVQAFVPECVTGTKDQVETVEVTDEDGNVTTETRPVYQGIDQSKLVPLLTAALQEALADIATLKAEVAALKGEPA